MPSSQPERERAPAEELGAAARFRARARTFDAPALLAAVREAFPGKPIRFACHPSLIPQMSIVHDVEALPDQVIITLNVGQRSATSPLASYFLEFFASGHIGHALADVIAFADDRLLRDRVDALRPEASPRLLPRPAAMRKDALALARPASPIAMHWIFSAVYPELGVTVRRASVRRGMPAEEPRLGSARLGRAAMGVEAEVMTPGIEIVLTTEDSKTWPGRPWADEARARLRERVFPAIRGFRSHLRVVLVDLEGKGRLALARPAQMGFDALVEPRPPKVALLFEGVVPSEPRASASGPQPRA